MTDPLELARQRFLETFEVVGREGEHLAYSLGRLSSLRIDAEWVRSLERQPELAERLEAFVSRFGRMQDTIADRLLPRWLLALAEAPGSQIETLNRAERLGVLSSAESWLAARKLRNRLVHEYMRDPQAFAEALKLAQAACDQLFDTYERLRGFSRERMTIASESIPPAVNVTARRS